MFFAHEYSYHHTYCIFLLFITPIAIAGTKDFSYLAVFGIEIFFFPNLDFYLNHNRFKDNQT